MTIRIIAQPGVGDWTYGSVLDVPADQEARIRRSLIVTGYAVEVTPKPKKKAKE